ncbi:hypothetical protein FRC18_002757 [Serendipita sp. 400]|nr:hypothetical protein FRC18_002757 [Serendipita sp. 400]
MGSGPNDEPVRARLQPPLLAFSSPLQLRRAIEAAHQTSPEALSPCACACTYTSTQFTFCFVIVFSVVLHSAYSYPKLQIACIVSSPFPALHTNRIAWAD